MNTDATEAVALTPNLFAPNGPLDWLTQAIDRHTDECPVLRRASEGGAETDLDAALFDLRAAILADGSVVSSSWQARAEAAEVLVDVVSVMYDANREADPYHLGVLFARFEQWQAARSAFAQARPFPYAAEFADREALLETIAVDLLKAIERLRWENDPQASGAAVRAHPKLHGVGALAIEDCPVCQRQISTALEGAPK